MKLIELSKQGWKNKGKYKAIIDDDIFEEVNKYNWSYSYYGYAYNKKMNIYLHVYIWKLKNGDIPSDKEIEHIDQNGLNCQLSNLRLATHAENMCNKSKYKNNKSGFKGICKVVHKKQHKDKIYTYEKWHAEIKKDKKKKLKKRYQKDFPYTDEGFEQAKKWIEQKSLDVQGEFSIYNKDK